MVTAETRRIYMREYRRRASDPKVKEQRAAKQRAAKQGRIDDTARHNADCDRIADLLSALPLERLCKLVKEKWGTG